MKNGFLVITARHGESFFIGDIEIQINEYSSNQVRIAICAPIDVRISRKNKITDEDKKKQKHKKPPSNCN